MPAPGVTYIPVHAKIQHPTNGTAAAGTITFSVPQPLRDQADHLVLGPVDIVCTLDANGECTASLPATDSNNVSPSGWAYTVTIRTSVYSDTFALQVPAATVGTFELADHAPAVTPTATATYALANHTHAGGGGAINTIRSGVGAPPNTTGIDGDYYYATDTKYWYGPKSGGVWSAGFSVVGPTGLTGPQGNTVLYGSGAPASGTGVQGNFYIDTTANFLYGPKGSVSWPSGTSLVGPTGNTGPQGSPGNTGAAGAGVYYPVSAYGAITLSVDPAACTSALSFGNGILLKVRLLVPAGKAITGACTWVNAAGVVGAGGVNGFGLYDSTGAQLATTVDDNTLWSSSGWRSKAFPSQIAAQGTDRFVELEMIVNGYSSAPTTVYTPANAGWVSGGVAITNRRCVYQATTTHPASFNPATYGTDAGQTMLMGLY